MGAGISTERRPLLRPDTARLHAPPAGSRESAYRSMGRTDGTYDGPTAVMTAGGTAGRTATAPGAPKAVLLALLLVLLACVRSSQASQLPKAWVAPVSEVVIGDEAYPYRLTLTTSMLPQRVHPMGDRRGGGGGGFINQHMKLLTLLTLAIRLKVEAVILPPAISRDTFEDKEAKWQVETAGSLWDIKSIAALLEEHHIELQLGTESVPPAGAVQLPSYFCRVLEVDHLVAEVHRLTGMHIAKLPERPDLKGGAYLPVTVYAPDLILALRTDALPLYAEVARAVKFAPALVAVADGVTSQLLIESLEFNGLHLRVEGDMRQTHNTSIESGLLEYYDLIRQLRYKSSPLYIASGIFVEGGRVDIKRYSEVDLWLNDRIIGEGRASRIVNRRLLVREYTASSAHRPDLYRLHSEQRAAVDFLVLLRAGKIIGTRMSSFSFMVREFRALAGLPRETSGMVGNVWELFQAAASFAVP